MSEVSSNYSNCKANCKVFSQLRLVVIAMAVLILPAYAEAPTDPYYTDCMPFPKNRHAEYP